MRHIPAVFILLFIGIIPIYSQEQAAVVSRSIPRYVPTAKAVGANGAVEVFVGIDQEGNVISAQVLNGHPLLRSVSREAAEKWKFAKAEDARSLMLIFNFGEGQVRVVEKSEKDEENVEEASFPNPYYTVIRLNTLVPKLLLLPREKGKIKTRLCELHEKEMEVEILSILQNEDDSEFYGENYSDAQDAHFPNANNILYRSNLNKNIEKAEVHYCEACRREREKWVLKYKVSN